MPWRKQFDVEDTLHKAMHAFWTRGYEATSMQDLVDATGINRGSLYATYGDKRGLFLRALRKYEESIRVDVLQGLESGNTHREAIRRIFLSFAAHTNEAAPSRGCFLTNTALELSAHDAEAAAIVAEGQGRIEAFFLRMIREGKRSGAIAARVRPTETARGLLASLLGLIVLSRSRPDPALLRSIVDEAMRRLG